jgi:histone-lysine N-methyltransferase SETDB1
VQGGKNYGDEYLAELDYIEVVEKLKEGYESDIVDDSDSSFEEKGSSEARRTKGMPYRSVMPWNMCPYCDIA